VGDRGEGQVVKPVLRWRRSKLPAVVLTEDPPFGGLWCDQPAIFLWAEGGYAASAEHVWGGMGTPATRHYRVSAASLRTIGTKVSKSTGLGTCRSKPASIAAATSPAEA